MMLEDGYLIWVHNGTMDTEASETLKKMHTFSYEKCNV